MALTYDTHDNGGRTYRVRITGNHVTVGKISGRRSRPLFELVSSEVFIGRSPENNMTRFSGGFGPRFDGNSLLVKLEDENTYLHIGRDLVTFRTKSPVTEYVSPVGNNDVPYPYAVDEQGNYYLVIESVILLAKPGLDEEAEGRGNDPYTYYYNLALMSTDLGRTPPRQAVGGLFHNIKYFTVGQEQYTMTYHTDPDETYDRLTKQDGGQMMLHYNDGTAEEIDRDQYADLMEEFAELRGFEAMDIVSTTEH